MRFKKSLWSPFNCMKSPWCFALTARSGWLEYYTHVQLYLYSTIRIDLDLEYSTYCTDVQVLALILVAFFSHSSDADVWRIWYVDPYLVRKLALRAFSRYMGRHSWYCTQSRGSKSAKTVVTCSEHVSILVTVLYMHFLYHNILYILYSVSHCDPLRRAVRRK